LNTAPDTSPDMPFGEVIAESDALRILFVPGSGASADVVLSFTGVALRMGGIAQPEFARSLANQAVMRDTYFIIDRNPTWYNHSDQEILDVLAPRLAGRRVHTLGNSMGGFGAILFSRLLAPCVSATAFVPQYSIRTDLVPFETRWTERAALVSQWRHPTCLSGTTTANPPTVFCGADRAGDLQQAGLIHAGMGGQCAVFIIADCGHDVARHLRERGALADLLDTAMSFPGQPARIAQRLDHHGIAYAAWPLQLDSDTSKSG